MASKKVRWPSVLQQVDGHAWGKGGALTLTPTWTDLGHAALSEPPDARGLAACEPIYVKRPGRVRPRTGSGFVVVRAWGGRQE